MNAITYDCVSREKMMEKSEKTLAEKPSDFVVLGLFVGIVIGAVLANSNCSMWWTPVLAAIGLCAGAIRDNVIYRKRIKGVVREPDPRACRRQMSSDISLLPPNPR